MIRVTLLRSKAPRQVEELSMQLHEGTTAAQALTIAGWSLAASERAGSTSTQDIVGIWGRKADPLTVLREGDRVEIYRALRVDPKVARRERFVGQGAKAAGLFSRRRPSSKAGY